MVLRLLPWALWALMMIFTLGTFDGMPAELPQNISSAGAVTRSVEKNLLSWLALPLIAGGVQIFMTWLTMLLPTQPELFNFPEKERFLKLPAGYRGDVIERMQQTMDGISAFTMLFMFGVQVMLWRTALGHSAKGTTPFIVAGSFLFLPVILILASRVGTAVEIAEKQLRAATAGTDSRTSGPR